MTAIAWTVVGLLAAGLATALGLLGAALFAGLGRIDSLAARLDGRIDSVGDRLENVGYELRSDIRDVRNDIHNLDGGLTSAGG